MSSLSEWIKLHIITEIVLLMYRNNLTDTVKKQFLLFSMEMELLNFIMCFDRMQNFKEAVTHGQTLMKNSLGSSLVNDP